MMLIPSQIQNFLTLRHKLLFHVLLYLFLFLSDKKRPIREVPMLLEEDSIHLDQVSGWLSNFTPGLKLNSKILAGKYKIKQNPPRPVDFTLEN